MNISNFSEFHHELLTNQKRVTRRQLFGRSAMGLGSIALASMLGERHAAAAQPGLPNIPHFAPKAKRVVCLWQGGGPSHLDLFDPKPMLQKMSGQDIPESVRGTTRLSTMSSGNSKWPIIPAIKPFQHYG
ncbi:MAG: DUF1501 domain-containing protein, partial [Verrucomicrobiaceae bacterium]